MKDERKNVQSPTSSVNQIMKQILLTLAILAACNAAPIGQGIKGIVLLGPQCPVVQVDNPCPDKPYQTDLVVTSADGMRTIKLFSSNADGSFQVTLAAGEYAIRSLNPGGLPSCSSEGTVIVRAGALTETTVFCDTGIR